MSKSAAKATFHDVLVAEASAINARRSIFAMLAPMRGGTATTRVMKVHLGAPDERGEPLARPTQDSDLVGLSLSGGGIRSAAFCLGVLQGLDAVVEDGKPQILDAVDYLSTVSGGGYIGASLVAGMTQEQGRFPFASKLDQAETVQVQHLRDHSRYLAPGGALDLIGDLIAVLRGLLVNAVILLSMIFFGAFVTVLLNQDEGALRHPFGDAPFGDLAGPFTWTVALGCVFAVVQFAYAVVSNRPGSIKRTSLLHRERIGTLFVCLLLVGAVVALLELQGFVLIGLFDAAHLDRTKDYAAHSGWLGKLFGSLVEAYGKFWTLLVAAVTAFGAFGPKLLKVAAATLGDKTWGGAIKHWLSRIAIYVGGVIVPLALWAVYLTLTYQGIAWQGADETCGTGSLSQTCALGPHTPVWIGILASPFGGKVWAAYLFLFLVLFSIALFVTPNAGSLHGLYRDRLSRAFLWDRATLDRPARREEAAPNRIWEMLRAKSPASPSPGVADALKLSDLWPATPQTSRKAAQQGSKSDTPGGAPYLLLNTAVNLEASEYLNRRGRNADSFFFSPLYTGSAATGYVETRALEDRDAHIDLATAMAISGAAASANMGASTIRPLTLSLAVLNIRLGYWLPNPRMISAFQGWRRILAQIGPWYFTKEALGLLDENTSNVYLTDGGHFDNLGLYELLKRRCKVVIAVDAEADPPMNFESLVRLQRYARIDLGVRVDLPWEDLRRFSREITADMPHGPSGRATDCIGPHIAVGRIEYGPSETGVLIYIKSCISGDENDLIRDYHRRNQAFPHETTLDQFFTEEQFEVYRALGFHATQSFFFGKDRFAGLEETAGGNWTMQLRSALHQLNIPLDAIAKIAARQRSLAGHSRSAAMS